MTQEVIFTARDVFKTARHWRMRAEEARIVAESRNDPTARAVTLRIADDYDRLAEHARESETLDLGWEKAVWRWRPQPQHLSAFPIDRPAETAPHDFPVAVSLSKTLSDVHNPNAATRRPRIRLSARVTLILTAAVLLFCLATLCTVAAFVERNCETANAYLSCEPRR